MSGRLIGGMVTAAARNTLLLERLTGRPLAIHAGRLGGVIDAVRAGLFETLDEAMDAEDNRPARGPVEVVQLRGPILSNGDWFTRGWLGWPDHAALGALADELAADDRVKAVVLAIDSPGGDVQGVFEAADKWAALAARKPVVAVADHNAYSAAYLYASTARRVYVSRAGGVGSIGVIAAHADVSGHDAQLGVRYTFLTFGERKAEGNPHQPLSDRARSSLQAEVDRLGEAFVAAVAERRGLAVEAVRRQEAAVFHGPAGVEAGLADQIGTLEDAQRDLTASLSPFGARAPWPPWPGRRSA